MLLQQTLLVRKTLQIQMRKDQFLVSVNRAYSLFRMSVQGLSIMCFIVTGRHTQHSLAASVILRR